MAIDPRSDLLGKSYGLWKVIGKAPDRRKQIFYLCQCRCGVTKTIIKSALVGGKSNGCVKCTRAKQPIRDKSPSWKGGRQIDENGYILVYDPNHPKAKRNGYVREHTKVMEVYLGRSLTKQESVHHINGERSDNRIENLELWSKSQPYGQRVTDKVKWALEILKEYAPECLINQY